MLTVSILLGACSSMNKAQKGGVIGGAGGAVIGGVIGKAAGNTVLGAILGAAVGGTVGVVIGNKMDKQAEEIKKNVPGVKVDRVGEGVVIEFSEKILFDYNKYDLKPQSKRGLDKFVTIIAKYPDTNIEIQGHTDSKGTAEYNQTLSEKRAGAAENYLTSNGVSAGRITVKGMGADYPKVENDTEEHRAQNRRVTFLITANETMKSAAAKEAGNTK